MIAFSSKRRAERQAAERLYAACVAAARQPGLYTLYGVPDTLQGRFEMMTLNLFPIISRLMHDPGDDPRLARLVSESFVADMDAAFREMGVGDITVPKRMRTLYRSFAGRIAAYGAAAAAGRPEREAVIARNVFPDGAEAWRTAALAAYLESALAALRGASMESLRRGEAPFPEPAFPGEEVRGP